jgi:two-component system nitrate/nitrite response regulator NarL
MLSPHLQELASPLGRKPWCVAYAGISTHVRTSVTGLCARHPAFRFCGQRASATQLVKEGALTPDIILMDDALLSRRGLTELAQLHRALPSARTLLIGDSLQSSTISAAIRLGAWGMLPKARMAVDLDRALFAVAGGELWLTRRQFAAVMASTNCEPDEDFMELTARENTVMRRVLLGQSNKQIARGLGIAEHTVKIHLHHAYSKLRVHSRMELLLHYRATLAFRTEDGSPLPRG